MVLKSKAKESAGRGDTFKMIPRKKLKRGGCACRYQRLLKRSFLSRSGSRYCLAKESGVARNPPPIMEKMMRDSIKSAVMERMYFPSLVPRKNCFFNL
jgi:hypothetical protein